MPGVRPASETNGAWEVTKVILRTAAVTALAYRTIQWFRNVHLAPAQAAASKAGRFFRPSDVTLPATGHKVLDFVREAAVFHPLATAGAVLTGWLGLEALAQAGHTPPKPTTTLVVSDEAMNPSRLGTEISIPSGKVEQLRGDLGAMYKALERGEISAGKADLAFACIEIALDSPVLRVGAAGVVVRAVDEGALKEFATTYELEIVTQFLDERRHQPHVTMRIGESYQAGADVLTLTLGQNRKLPRRLQMDGDRVIHQSMDALDATVRWHLREEADIDALFRAKLPAVLEEIQSFAAELGLTELQQYLAEREYEVHTKLRFHDGSVEINGQIDGGLRLPWSLRGKIEEDRVPFPLAVVHDCLLIESLGEGTLKWQEACLRLARRYPARQLAGTPTKRQVENDLPARAAFAKRYELNFSFWEKGDFRQVREKSAGVEVRVDAFTDLSKLVLSRDDLEKLPEAIRVDIARKTFGVPREGQEPYPELTIQLTLEWLIAGDKRAVENEWRKRYKDVEDEAFGDLYTALVGGFDLLTGYDLEPQPNWTEIANDCNPDMRTELKEGRNFIRNLFGQAGFLLDGLDAPKQIHLRSDKLDGLSTLAPALHGWIDEGIVRGVDRAVLNNCVAMMLDETESLPDSKRGQALQALILKGDISGEWLQEHVNFADRFELTELGEFFKGKIGELEQRDGVLAGL